MQIVMTGKTIKEIVEQMKTFLSDINLIETEAQLATQLADEAGKEQASPAPIQEQSTAQTDIALARMVDKVEAPSQTTEQNMTSTDFFNEVTQGEPPSAEELKQAVLNAKDSGVDMGRIKAIVTKLGAKKVSDIAPEKRQTFLDELFELSVDAEF